MVMDKQSDTKRTLIQRCFTARELQFTIALLTVIALLSGIFLQALSSALINYYGFHTAVLGVFLVLGYAVIVFLLSVFFTHRLVGPFKRIEYEMKLISKGELSRRITTRANDDLHVRNFVAYANEFIANFEKMSKDYNMLNSAVSKKLDELGAELSRDNFDCVRLKAEIADLREHIHKFREKW
jgi:signal transduction histidine kinase